MGGAVKIMEGANERRAPSLPEVGALHILN
jgi:hypothetical protein